MNQTVTLDRICPGQSAVVQQLDVGGAMRRRFLDIGLIENTAVECLGRSPGGDPSAYLIRGAVIAIRAQDCRGIRVCIPDSDVSHAAQHQTTNIAQTLNSPCQPVAACAEPTAKPAPAVPQPRPHTEASPWV